MGNATTQAKKNTRINRRETSFFNWLGWSFVVGMAHPLPRLRTEKPDAARIFGLWNWLEIPRIHHSGTSLDLDYCDDHPPR
jgi:hypothetical protein